MKDGEGKSALRALPSVDRVISQPRLAPFASLPHQVIVDQVRQELEAFRARAAAGEPLPSLEALVDRVSANLNSLLEISLRPVINATGVILHTNLGRAPLSHEALETTRQVAAGYSNLELDLPSGARGSRHTHPEQLLCRLTGAQAALVVNNNASAVLLALMALARGKEVIISRGQAVEIGGGFRIPDVMRQSGARLVEVGTTNRTYLSDYEEAIGPRTGALMRVHTSNFRVVGFTQEVELAELAALARRHALPLIDDLGSGCLLDTRQFGLGYEPTPQDSLAAGASLACFSGDKLLGGPQAGIIVGEADLVRRLKRHPLARAVRIDKLSLAALLATLLHYLKGEAVEKVPVWRMISADLGELAARAQRWAAAVPGMGRVVDGESTVGGGSLPGETLPTKLLSLAVSRGRGTSSVTSLARRLRTGHPPVVARIEKERLLLDPRTVLPEQDEALMEALATAIS
ncbi:MAG: L-seryl-tRNA(Sec) selenium transferase [Dehalococcoidia bacterium]|nr:L-seryl-tRNA(Sec) selenium transferase [Dehalococcoidia bacterium]